MPLSLFAFPLTQNRSKQNILVTGYSTSSVLVTKNRLRTDGKRLMFPVCRKPHFLSKRISLCRSAGNLISAAYHYPNMPRWVCCCVLSLVPSPAAKLLNCSIFDTGTKLCRIMGIPRESRRVFSGSGIWPKYDAGIGKTINILTGSAICLLSGKRYSPKFGHGRRDFFLPVCQEFGKLSQPKWTF